MPGADRILFVDMVDILLTLSVGENPLNDMSTGARFPGLSLQSSQWFILRKENGGDGGKFR